MNSFAMSRPNFSVVGVGFVAGVARPQAVRARNIAVRYRIAAAAFGAAKLLASYTGDELATLEADVAGAKHLCELRADMADFSHTFGLGHGAAPSEVVRMAWRVMTYIRAVRKLGSLPSPIESYLGIIEAPFADTGDTRKLDALVAESLRDAKRSKNRANRAAR